jgi:hypothetical protein
MMLTGLPPDLLFLWHIHRPTNVPRLSHIQRSARSIRAFMLPALISWSLAAPTLLECANLHSSASAEDLLRQPHACFRCNIFREPKTNTREIPERVGSRYTCQTDPLCLDQRSNRHAVAKYASN